LPSPVTSCDVKNVMNEWTNCEDEEECEEREEKLFVILSATLETSSCDCEVTLKKVKIY
jgi:hypothetical protein